MRAEDIKPGMWLRWSVVDAPVMAADVASREDVCFIARELNGAKTLPAPDECEPWTPRVGEWVRDSRGDVWRVDGVWPLSGHPETAYGRSGHGVVRESEMAELEPCLPPKAEGKAGLDTSAVQEAAQAAVETLQAYQAHQVAEAAPQAKVQRIRVTSAQIGGVDVSEDFFAFTDLMDARYRAHQAAQPKACDCRRCTGPVATLLTMPCQGEDWRKAEPNTYEVWVEPMTGRWVPAGSRTVPFDGAELAYHAAGRGLIRQHPIREEAIRLWREAVR